MSLLEIFESLSDPRRAAGRRTSVAQIFSIVLLSYLCGYTGYRGVGRFALLHADLLREELGLKHAVPSYVTFRDLLLRVDKSDLVKKFNSWAGVYAELSPGDWLSGDGKALCSTVSDYGQKSQDFECVVSLFSHNVGLVVMVESYRNKKKSEIGVLLEMINMLKVNGLIIRTDALHTQKKRLLEL